MANTRSALKRVRKTKTETARNRFLKEQVKLSRRTVLEAVAAGDAKAAGEAYHKLASSVDKAAKRGAIHKNAASRAKSRAAAKVAALSA